jgi:glucokinase
MSAIGVDVGGTKIVAGHIDAAGNVHGRVEVSTPGDDVTIVDAVIEVLVGLRRDDPSAPIGVGLAAWLDRSRTVAVFAPNLPLRHVPFASLVSSGVGVTIDLENDATAAAWAEHRFGAALGSDVSVMVSLGTGVGGGAVVDGQPLRGGHGLAGEFGHMRLVPGGHVCGCGRRGCVEAYVSGNALGERARIAAAEAPGAFASLLASTGGIESITGAAVGRAALAGDAACRAVVAEVGADLGVHLADLAAAFDPDVLVVGGGAGSLGELLLGPARAACHAESGSGASRPLPDVRSALLGPDAAMIGAGDLARVSVSTRPD